MAIQRWDPLRGLMDLQEKMNHLFEDTLSRTGGREHGEAEASSGWKLLFCTPRYPPVRLVSRFLSNKRW